MKKLFLTIFKNKTHQGACKDGFQTRTFEEPDLSKIKNQQFDKSKAPLIQPKKKKTHPFLIHS